MTHCRNLIGATDTCLQEPALSLGKHTCLSRRDLAGRESTASEAIRRQQGLQRNGGKVLQLASVKRVAQTVPLPAESCASSINLAWNGAGTELSLISVRLILPDQYLFHVLLNLEPRFAHCAQFPACCNHAPTPTNALSTG